MEELAQRLTGWIREHVAAAGAKGVVLGMSGGVDSSVLSVLCHRAFPDNTLGLILPCHSDPQDEEHAWLVARNFGISARRVELDGIYDRLVESLSNGELPAGNRRLGESNLKPRLRMTALYYFANRLNYMVVGSSNRCEITVGYYSKYGDGGVDLMPLGNLVKRQVWELALYLGVPQVIIARPPSAGLWPGQTDEREMGLSYAELDRYLETGQASPQVRDRIEFLRARSAHKRILPPIPGF